MQDAQKFAVTASVAFTVGVLTGWLLNQYTRKTLDKFLTDLQGKVKKM